MRKIYGGAAVLVLGGALVAALAVRAENKPAAKGPDEDGTKPALVKIAGEGMMDSHAYQYLTELSDDVGARVTGSPQAEKAIEWGEAKMRAIGLENVHTEKWQLWRGWTRGTAQAELLAPIRHPLHVDAMGWTGSTPAGGAEGDVVEVNMFDLDNEIKNASRLSGKVALVVTHGQPSRSFHSIVCGIRRFSEGCKQSGRHCGDWRARRRDKRKE